MMLRIDASVKSLVIVFEMQKSVLFKLVSVFDEIDRPRQGTLAALLAHKIRQGIRG
jgi:hypothetical protein